MPVTAKDYWSLKFYQIKRVHFPPIPLQH